MTDKDTIAALATAPGRSGIAIIRVSGERAEALLNTLFSPKKRFTSHLMEYGHIVHNGETLDECMAVLMRAPRSYTRQDVVELHLHGGDFAAGRTLSALYALGARPAEPGEFTRRAFENGRIDLARAEAVMQLIQASGERGARAAVKQLSGGTSAFVADAQARLLSLLSGVAAALDFPDEVDEREAAEDIAKGAREIAAALTSACDERAAKLLCDGLDCVLCGLPNVGKSSLLNRLLDMERAIVSDIPGTTRDIVSGAMYIDGVRVNLLDTAGIRESGETIERIGVARAMRAISGADCALMLMDASRAPSDDELALLASIQRIPHGVLLNKSDLLCDILEDEAVRKFMSNCTADMLALLANETPIVFSARTGAGMDKLRALLAAFARTPSETVLVNARHIRLAREAQNALNTASAALLAGESIDVTAVELQDALRSLGRITGDDVDEKLLDDIFAQFCVGK